MQLCADHDKNPGCAEFCFQSDADQLQVVGMAGRASPAPAQRKQDEDGTGRGTEWPKKILQREERRSEMNV